MAKRLFQPAFSPGSCYFLRDPAEEIYFASHGGAPEAKLIDWATQFIQPDQIFVDVGAHVGSWTQHFAQRCVEVHAFEPQKSTFERLLDGVRRAGFSNVVCHDKALGGRGETLLHIVSEDGGGSTLRPRHELGAVLSTEKVCIAHLDDFDLKNVGLVKVDAEGFELDILKGAAKLLKEHRPVLLLEAWCHAWYAAERTQLFEHLASIDYGVVPIQGWPEMWLAEPIHRHASLEEHSLKMGALVKTTGGEKGSLQEVSKPLLGLTMIVKNESARIEQVLQSYSPYIDRWTILDTGSTDGTQDLVRKTLGGVPGALYEEPFVDFATSRNRALSLHGTSTVFSIMPNGDVLYGGSELRAFLDNRRLDSATGAYRIRITPGHYYHPLVMRTGTGWHYRWRTHECAVGPALGEAVPNVSVHRDRGKRTEAEWQKRWERDLVLLNRDRAEDPSDPRPYFYLGQTYECLGDFSRALAFFERRAEMGGYFDEVYEALYRIGEMKKKLGRPWADIQQAYLEAYEYDPRRAEPLFAISEYWYEKNHAVSRLFSVAAAALPKPPTDLFLDEDLYSWKAADRAAISSFYAGRKEEGRYWAEKAVEARPEDERLRANRAFFAQSAKELFGAVSQSVDFVPPQGWHASNPSIFNDGIRTRCIVRTVNYSIDKGSYITSPTDVVENEGPYKGWQIIRTRNFIIDLDENLKTTRAIELIDRTGDSRSIYPVHGFEDARLFAWADKWWASATVCNFTEEGRREIALFSFEEDGSIVQADPLRGPWSMRDQKNWMPFVQKDSLTFVYAVIPPITLTMSEAGAPLVGSTTGSWEAGRLRGGSQGVRVEGGWICLVHDVAFSAKLRIYLHRFVRLNEDFKIEAMTDPFYFDKLGIEFCAGLARIGNTLVASYAVNDGIARYGIFEWEAVLKALQKEYVI